MEREKSARGIAVKNRSERRRAARFEFSKRGNDTLKHGTFSGRTHSVSQKLLGETGRISFSIFDESLRYAANAFVLEEFEKKISDSDDLPALKQLLRPSWNFGQTQKIDDDTAILALYNQAYFFDKIFVADTSHVAFPSFGVLADWPQNCLKKNLSAENFDDEIFPKGFLANSAGLGNDAPEFPDAGTPMASSAEKEPFGKLNFSNHPFPILADVKLHLGFFNTRSDGQHRARFHISAAFWNPFSFPLIAQSGGNIGLINFAQLPQISITNLNTTENFSFEMSNIPRGQFGIVKQTDSDATFNVNGKIFDTLDQGFGSNRSSPDTGLHPGEIFWARFPDPESQPQGLSRITGGATWKYQSNVNKPTTPPSCANGNRWFHSTHDILIRSFPAALENKLEIQYYNGNFSTSTLPENYSTPFWTLKNFELPELNYTLKGEEYNRSLSTDYSLEDVNVVFWIRLK